MKQGLLNVDFCVWSTPCGIALRKKALIEAFSNDEKS